MTVKRPARQGGLVSDLRTPNPQSVGKTPVTAAPVEVPLATPPRPGGVSGHGTPKIDPPPKPGVKPVTPKKPGEYLLAPPPTQSEAPASPPRRSACGT